MEMGVTEHRRGLAPLALVATALAVGTMGPSAAAGLLVIGGVGSARRGMTGLVGWIVGGALLGGAIGYGAVSAVQLPLSPTGAVGLGVALGGGLGGIVHLLSTEEPASAEDERVTVDMAGDSSPDPRPADLFEEHPDPVLYVADAGAGPVVRAANAAYEAAFDLPAATLEDAPLGDVLVTEGEAGDLVERVAAGEDVDEVRPFETPAGTARYRVRSVGPAADGYLLFTPVEN